VFEASVFFFFVSFLVVAGVSGEYAVGIFTPEVRTSVKRDLIYRERRPTINVIVPTINGVPESAKGGGAKELLSLSTVSATVERFVGERGGDLGGERGRRGAALSIGIGEPLTLP
jgi:hypothetical protein